MSLINWCSNGLLSALVLEVNGIGNRAHGLPHNIQCFGAGDTPISVQEVI